MASLDNVKLVRNLQAANSELPEEPKMEDLHEAIRGGKTSLFHKIMGKNPELARVKNRFGGYTTTALHLATEKGNHEMIKALLEKYPQLCMVRDKSSRTPLQVAAQMGVDRSVISELIAACPQSLKKLTEKKETVFHLALKNGKVEAFQVLLEEAEKLDQLHLLERKDFQGNNVLHIAASKKLSEVVRMLVPRDSTSDYWVRVNSLNKKRLTALDICRNQSTGDKITREIYQILRNAGGRGRSLAMRAPIGSTLATKNVILVVLGIVIGASFTAVCNIPGSFLENESAARAVFHVRDVIHCHLPHVFYLLVFNTAIFIVSMFAILVILWSLPPFRPVVLFVTITIVIVYGILVDNILPRFWVKYGRHHKAVGTQLVFILAFAFICSATAVYCIFYGSLLCLRRFTKR